MKKNLFISDIDGTIYRDKTVSKEELEFLNLLNPEYHLVLATGRNYVMFQKFIEEYPIEYEFCVLNNGALVLDKCNRVILNLNLKTADVLPIIGEMLEKIEVDVNITFSYLFKNDFMIGINKGNYEKKFSRLSSDLVNSISLEINDYEEILENIDKMKNKIQNMGLTTHQNKQFIDVSPKESGKANSLICLAKILKSDIDQAIIVGDELNDIEMLMLTSKSYCMISGNKKLIDVTNYQIQSLEEIETIGKNHE